MNPTSKIATPENTTIPTPQSAVQEVKRAIEGVAKIQNERVTILKYLYELNQIAERLW
jgi:hypothetical protein